MKIRTVSTIEELEELIQDVKKAQKIYSTYSQEKVDHIFKRAAISANAYRIWLARMAVEETGMGVLEDKVIKNHFAAEYIFNKYKNEKTCGILEEDTSFGIKKIAEPVGIVAGIVPTTNPTSTTIFKALLALKTRNGIIFSPHPRAKKCTVAAARIMLEAAVAAGAPDDIIGWITEPSIELTQYLMKHPDINLILATGGPGMVKAAYSSGKPAIGVGAGNTPAVIDETAHIKMAVSSILLSKTFDNGTICASEQAVVVVDKVYEEVKKEFIARGAYFLTKEEAKKVGETIVKDGKLNSAIVGQPAYKIAKLAGIEVPKDTKVLIAEVEKIGSEEPFSYEKLSPTLAMYRARNFEEAVDKAVKLVEFGGMGHTSVLYTDQINKDRIDYFGSKLKTGRVLINMPSSQGAIGDVYNFKLEPSLTLGCGSWGGNSVSENVGVKHLLNIKTIAERRENMLWFKVPPKIYFKTGCLPTALQELKEKKRAFIVTDKFLFENGFVTKIEKVLEELNIETEVFFEVEPDPSIETVKKGLAIINSFKPDVIIALGGGSPMDAAKVMWLMYEHPEVKFEGLALRFMDIRKRIYTFPELGKKAVMVAIPTTSGTGSEVTPFAVVTDNNTGLKYPIADYELTPDMAIIDPELTMSMPKKLTAYSGIDALVHAIEAYVSVFANEYTNGLALEAIRLIFKYLPESYEFGEKAVKAREKMAYASCIAGMAFANAFLGLCHSMAHKLGSAFHIPHGLSNALLISHVIKYNATDKPLKQTAFPQYKYPIAKERYARIADYLNLKGKTQDEKVKKLIEAIEELKEKLNIPKAIKDLDISEEEFYARLDQMAEYAFDDQCTPANPRYPLISEIKQLYIDAYHGKL
ncbi:bifunctional acetaldehyde-CoA/alcohol dehydrogenase [Thermosipho sp. 1244]|uniref:bifunctional acetaldehyde-CoA/alcohol dehydrogenase n=1 Tax=Thermosipho sp. 1244 TaxID=1755816 RepID=UPI001BDE714A|nr:bifunctional acetaldehyde-CoA/alcohol dehydrogenase [Thermosipho sp. 1244]MBT1248281.1 bifunctional acetaldehyde-CoA/alcohol dehydrogenase [Thermosipho sp. 1244]